MKGVILGRCPNANIIDITHDLPAFSILPTAYNVAQSARFFPVGTIHVIVVDPGVGTDRKPILAEAADQLFVAPDNGVLSLILANRPSSMVREITNHSLWLDCLSETFHGRDVFAPVAAFLASGIVSPEDVGPVLSQPVQLAGLDPQKLQPGMWRGLVLNIDHFGNVITNFPSKDFKSISTNAFILEAKGRRIQAFYPSFGHAQPGVTFAYHGSSGFVEIGINQQSAAKALEISAGQPITLSIHLA